MLVKGSAVPVRKMWAEGRKCRKGIDDLPDEILLAVFHSLSKKDVKRCALVCRRWKRIAYDQCFGLWCSEYITGRCLGRALPFEIISTAVLNGLDTLILRKSKVTHPVSWNVYSGGSLRYIYIWRTDISTKCLAYLIRRNPKLENVKFEDITVNADVCRAIATLPNLDQLLLKDCQTISKDEIVALAPALQRIRHLHIRNIPLGGEELDILTASLNPALNTLNIGSRKGALTDKHVFQILTSCSQLEILLLRNTANLSQKARTAVNAADVRRACIDLLETYEKENEMKHMSQFKLESLKRHNTLWRLS